jgi:peptidoglycan/LPS O-acetylase OafA/YrhL
MKKPTYGVFGIYRWFLASMVVLNHLGPKEYGYSGWYAVFSFFLLSGYIMSYILRTHYLRIDRGVTRFFLNRALRVYPAYWLVLIIMIPAAIYFPHLVKDIRMPVTTAEWLENTFAIGLTSLLSAPCLHTINPPAWALGNEMLWWLFIPGIVFNRGYLFIFLPLVVVFVMLVEFDTRYYGGRFLESFYYSPLSAMLPFAIGVVLYFRKEWKWRDLPKSAVIVVGWLMLRLYTAKPQDPYMYQGLFINGLAIYYLSGIEAKTLPPWFQRMDRLFGEISYPVFLLHFCAYLLVKGFFSDVEDASWPLFIIGFAITNVLAVAFYYTFEVRIEQLRNRVRY